MFTTIFFSVIYIFIATCAATLTLLEQKETGAKGISLRLLGLLACAVWPITVIIVGISARRHKA